MSDVKGVVTTGSNAVVHVAGHEVLGHQVSSLGGFVAAMGTIPTAIAALGLTAAISSVMMQLEYNQERKAIRRLYENELSAKLGKTPHALKSKDLQAVADGNGRDLQSNRTFAEALAGAKKKRNFGIGIAIIASLGSLALMTFALGPAGVVGHGLLAHGAAQGLGWGAMIAQATLGFLAYQAIKTPLCWASNKLFGLDKETAHDHIEAIHRDRHKGRFITREQVFSVFAAANKELGRMIKSQYGKEYDKLPLAAKQVVAISVGRMISLDKITDAINHGRMNPAELAFTVEGQVSGFDPSMAVHHQGMFSRIKNRLSGRHHAAEDPVHHAVPQPAMPVYSNEPPKVSFVDRLNQSRAAEASLLQQR